MEFRIYGMLIHFLKDSLTHDVKKKEMKKNFLGRCTKVESRKMNDLETKEIVQENGEKTDNKTQKIFHCIPNIMISNGARPYRKLIQNQNK